MSKMETRRQVEVVVVGGSQSGLAMSWHLKQRGIEHVVFEKHRVAHTWRTQRWDSFCLVTPNWQCQLPGFPYQGSDPDGFMVNADIVRYVEDYRASFDPPLHEGVAVIEVRQTAGGFHVDTTDGAYLARHVVVAVGGYHRPRIPRMAERLPDDIAQVHSSEYRNPAQLPPGEVLVVGTGQSGSQIAEDLHLARRRVHLATGSAPRVARRYRGRDVVAWLTDMGHYDMGVDEHPMGERVRLKSNHYVTGRDGGHDIDLRQFAIEGMRLYGHLLGLRGTQAAFAPDLRRNLDGADDSAQRIKDSIDAWIARNGINAPTEPRYRPVWQPEAEVESLDLRAAGITSVIWATGFESDLRFLHVPVFDGRGYPAHDRGVTPVPGLYFLGLPWLYTWGSGRFSGVGRDAAHLARVITGEVAGRPARWNLAAVAEG
ncbi:flavin-containing monooxygenase [Acidisphaera rubrifaciens HS-AP3]|uniref:Flavin-containing monooxygenase n=2 Tax=Acidisphaera TaxID=50714 RepID=A0A0D6P9K4_9PROT|nr:flavin-containing monooxygenase [Acidisphaera rubrifaciens HS-AP3]